MRRAACALALAAAAAAPSPALGAAEVRGPSRAEGATTARIVAGTTARQRPGAGRHVQRLRTVTSWSGQAQTLLVLDAEDEWVKVLLPIRPNGTAAWIPRRKVLLAHTPYYVRVRLRSRRVIVYRGGRRLRRFRAVVGAPATPTPTGLAAVYERNPQPDPHGFLGPWALPLTALSNVLESYGGGPGRVAIHGRAGASLRDPLGTARSHGCIRITSRAVTWMARRLRAGTPVKIGP
jgi:lipoprotein-anchoring transpeptidase ErfK/SrfK